MNTETIDKLFLELSQVTKATTQTEMDLRWHLAGAIKALERIQNSIDLTEIVREARVTRDRLIIGLK